MKYRFEITYQPKEFKKASELMRNMDFHDFEAALRYILTFTGDDRNIKDVKDDIVNTLENNNLTVLHIEGGKVE